MEAHALLTGNENYQEKEDRRTTQQLLRALAAPAPGLSLLDSDETLHAGHLFLETRFCSGYKLYWIFLKGNRLHCFRKQTDTKPKRVITVCFAAKTPLTTAEKETMGRQFPDSSAVSSSRILIFSSEHPVSVCAASESELKTWEDRILKQLSANMSAEAFQHRSEISKQLLPIVEQAVAHEIRRAEEFLKDLRIQGLVSPVKTLKQGHLKLLVEKADGQKWKKYYFCLYKRTLAYQADDKSTPKGTIALCTSTVTPTTWGKSHPDTSNNMHDIISQTNQSRGEELMYGFMIQAPFVTYKVKAKHQIAAAQWIEALEISKNVDFATQKAFNENVKRSTGGSLMDSPQQNEERPLPSYKKPYIEYTMNNKMKQVKLKGQVLTIGRSSTNDVSLEDKKISRQHAQIQMNSTHCVFIDLGSSIGSWRNGIPVTQAVLYPNDELIVGDTKIYFRVGSK